MVGRYPEVVQEEIFGKRRRDGPGCAMPPGGQNGDGG